MFAVLSGLMTTDIQAELCTRMYLEAKVCLGERARDQIVDDACQTS